MKFLGLIGLVLFTIRNFQSSESISMNSIDSFIPKPIDLYYFTKGSTCSKKKIRYQATLRLFGGQSTVPDVLAPSDQANLMTTDFNSMSATIEGIQAGVNAVDTVDCAQKGIDLVPTLPERSTRKRSATSVTTNLTDLSSDEDAYEPEESSEKSFEPPQRATRGRKPAATKAAPTKKPATRRGVRAKANAPAAAEPAAKPSTRGTRSRKPAVTGNATSTAAEVAAAPKGKPLSRMTKAEQKSELDRRHRAKEAQAATANFSYSRRPLPTAPSGIAIHRRRR